MPLDILSFRAFAGGDPDQIRESQRRRFKPVEAVDEIIAADETWRFLIGITILTVLPKKVNYYYPAFLGELDNLKKERNAVQKEVGLKKKAKEPCDDMVLRIKELDGIIAAKEDAVKDAKMALDKVDGLLL